ncbi:MAG: DUF927 domain-containing protein [Brevundimonas sp.]|uniref:DUF927 domain-containing protein n=1 Tax=Brevundimonas sp. TaxID=1871086 RepID=UPI00273665DA|nr:DUF927 domain-containing protein [Brevundimonas sp.]MDP3406600.1 DUF927 domain-containing protein [Brevundimonas sp.]
MTTGNPQDDAFARIASAVAQSTAEGVAPAPVVEEEVQVVPAPVDAPALPAFSKVGRLVASWPYRDASGAVLRHTLRFEKPDGEKDIRPVTLWRNLTTGRLVWRLKAGADPRPLYGLDRLAARPEAPVLIVEGEKTADAAQRLFPDMVAMTWPGGSNAVGKADWKALTARSVAVWPDADEPGLKAAQTVVRAVLAAGADGASAVDLSPNLPKGWDLADPWPGGMDLETAGQRIQRALRAGRTEVAFPPGYTAGAEGVFFQPPVDKDGDDAPPRQWLCSAIEFAALARDEDGEGWSIIVTFPDRDGRQHREIIGHGELAGDGTTVRSRLAAAGLQMAVSRSARERLQVLLSRVSPVQRARLVSSTGWKKGLYVMPHRTVGAPTRETVVFRGRPGGTYHGEAGSYDAWRSQVAEAMRGNALGLFAMSAGFAGPLLRDLGAEGGGFHFRGGSSTGKTTLLAAAGSVCGGGGPMGFTQSWRNTDNALEAVALAHNDGMLALDELRALAPEAAASAAYALATGATKGRLRADSELRARPTWLVIILSTGEIGLAGLINLARGRDKTYAGQELRLIDLAVDMGRDMGAWEEIHGAADPAAFSESIKRAAETHYGHALPMFVERYLANRAELLDAARAVQAQFLTTVLHAEDHGQARRGAQRFAVVAAAGELAALLDVVPWKPGEATAAAAALFRRWAAVFGRTELREDREAILRVRQFIERYEGSRFKALKEGQSEEDRLYDEATQAASREGEARSLDVAGYKGIHAGHGLVFHFNTETAKADLFLGLDADAALHALKKAGFLISNGGPGRLTNKVSIPGVGKRNFYSVSATIMEADLSDDAA